MGTDQEVTPEEQSLLDTQPIARPDVPKPTMRNPDQPVGVGPLGSIPPPPPEMTGQAPVAAPAQGQGFLGSLGAFLTKPPANTRPSFGESQSMVPSPPLGMAMPPAASLLGRSALQGGAAGIEALQQGKGPLDIAKEVGKGAAFNVGAEKILGPLANFIGKQFSAKGAQQAYEGAQATRAGKVAHDEAMTGALNSLEQAGYKKEVQVLRDKYAEDLRQTRFDYKAGKQATEQTHATQVAQQEARFGAAAGAHADQAAAKMAADLADNVPALAGHSKDTAGLVDMIYGSGKEKVAQAFDQALKDVVAKGKGQMVELPSEIAGRLGAKTAQAGDTVFSPQILESLKAAGRLPPELASRSGEKIAMDASELAQKMTGLWKRDPGAYRAAARALDEAGIGDPAAREAFKYYSGLSQYIDKTKALAGEKLNPDALLSGLTDLKKVEELRRRGIGHVNEGPTQAARSGPLAPPEIPKPVTPPYMPPARPQMPEAPMKRVSVAPPEVPKPDYATVKNPLSAHPFLGYAAGGAAGGLAGHALGVGPIGHAIGALLGAGVASAGPKQFVTKGPLSAGAQKAASNIPDLAGILARLGYNKVQGE